MTATATATMSMPVSASVKQTNLNHLNWLRLRLYLLTRCQAAAGRFDYIKQVAQYLSTLVAAFGHAAFWLYLV